MNFISMNKWYDKWKDYFRKLILFKCEVLYLLIIILNIKIEKIVIFKDKWLG